MFAEDRCQQGAVDGRKGPESVDLEGQTRTTRDWKAAAGGSSHPLIIRLPLRPEAWRPLKDSDAGPSREHFTESMGRSEPTRTSAHNGNI